MAQLQGIEGEQLDGWGDFKRSIGLNKLHTRKIVKTHVDAAKALFVPTKKNVKKAAASIGQNKLAAKAVAVGGNIVAPGAGTVAANYATGEAQRVEAQAAEAVLTAKTAAAMKAAARAEAATDEADAIAAEVPTNPWPMRLLWGSLALGTGAALYNSRSR